MKHPFGKVDKALFAMYLSNVIMSAIASQITAVSIVYSPFSRRWKKTSKLRATGFCGGNSSVTGEFLAQRASDAENVSIWRCYKV